MIALPRTRGFSAGNWQIPLTDNLNAAANGVYMALTYFGAEQTAGPFSKADFVRNRIRQQGGGSRRHKCHE